MPNSFWYPAREERFSKVHCTDFFREWKTQSKRNF